MLKKDILCALSITGESGGNGESILALANILGLPLAL